MKILFFDSLSTGHRGQYCRDFLNKLYSHKKELNLGLAVPRDFSNDGLNNQIKIYRMKTIFNNDKGIFQLYFKYLYLLFQAKAILKSKAYDILHILYIDVYKIPASIFFSLIPIKSRIFLTLHW